MEDKKQERRLRELGLMTNQTIERVGPHEVLTFMREMFLRKSVASINGNIEHALCQYGRPYTRKPLPKRVRLRRLGRCFGNAFMAAERGQGIYVEGLALQGGRLVHHAWISPDGWTALDVTWPDDIEASYFGIPIEDRLRAAFAVKTWWEGIFIETPIEKTMTLLASSRATM